MESLGFDVSVVDMLASYPFYRDSIGTRYGSMINDPDTWTSPLADDQADLAKTDVDSLEETFTTFLNALNTTHLHEPREVGNGTARACWPAAVSDD